MGTGWCSEQARTLSEPDHHTRDSVFFAQLITKVYAALTIQLIHEESQIAAASLRRGKDKTLQPWVCIERGPKLLRWRHAGRVCPHAGRLLVIGGDVLLLSGIGEVSNAVQPYLHTHQNP